MTEDNWQSARLIPTSGINGQEEAERRATSALLAVMSAVKEFGVVLTKPYGAPSNWLQTYIEVPFDLEGKKVIPDGLIRASRGAKTWTALVEVKTGSGEHTTLQVENYLDVARLQGFDAVLTISNQISHAPSVHPLKVDKRKVKNVALHHLSWAEILTEAVKQRVYRGVADPDQAWILGEFIRYLEHPKSGAADFDDMGEAWVSVRDAVSNSTLRPNNAGLGETVQRWEQLLRFLSLSLGRELGADVQVVLSRAEQADASLRLAEQMKQLVEHGTLSGAVRIPDAIGDLQLIADLRSNRVSVFVDVDAPQDGRATTRINWLVRQLAEAPPQLCIDAWVQGTRTSMSELLGDVREVPEKLVHESKKDLRRFRLTASAPLGTGRKVGRNSFVGSILDASQIFYQDVVQGLTPWSPKAPKMPTGGRTAVESVGIDTRPPISEVSAREAQQIEDGEKDSGATPSAPPQRPQWLSDYRPVVPSDTDEGLPDPPA